MRYFLILLVSCLTLSSQLLLKRAMATIGAPASVGYKAFFTAAFVSPYVIAAVGIQGFGFMCWMLVVQKMKLGPAFALSGASFYILLALMSWWLFGERLGYLQWLGLLCISVGVLLLTTSNT